MTVVPGFTDCHNHAGGDVLLYEVLVGNPFEVEFVTIDSIVDKLRAKAQQDAAGHLGRGLLLRRHEGEGQARRSTCTISTRCRREHPVVGASPRRPHVVLQQQGVRDGRRHQGHAESARRHVRPRRERRAERPRHRSRARRVQQGRQAADVHAGADARSATATASRTSRSSSSATA